MRIFSKSCEEDMASYTLDKEALEGKIMLAPEIYSTFLPKSSSCTYTQKSANRKSAFFDPLDQLSNQLTERTSLRMSRKSILEPDISASTDKIFGPILQNTKTLH